MYIDVLQATLLGVLAFFLFVFAVSAVRIVPQGSKGVVLRLGRYSHMAHEGLNFITPFFDTIRIVDVREQVYDFNPQAVITKDNVAIQIDTIIFYQVIDPVKALFEVANMRMAIEQLTMTTIRNIVGELDLDQTLTSRETINTKLTAIMDEATERWGVKINRVELKNIIPPDDIRQVMERQMTAERNKRAAILQAEGEKQAAILKAEGERDAAVAKATGDREAAILRAEGEAKATVAVQQAVAESLRMIRESQPDERVLLLKYYDALRDIANGQGRNKVFVPIELSTLAGGVGLIGNALKPKE